MRNKLLIIALHALQGAVLHAQLVEDDLVPHRPHVPKQSMDQILKIADSTNPPTQASKVERVFIPKQSLSEILKIPPGSKTGTEDPIRKLNDIVRTSQQYQETQILSLLGLQKEKPDRMPYMESGWTETDTTHKRSLPPSQSYNIDRDIIAQYKVREQEEESPKSITKQEVSEIVSDPEYEKMSQHQIIPINTFPSVAPSKNRDKVFSILSSTARNKAIFGDLFDDDKSEIERNNNILNDNKNRFTTQKEKEKHSIPNVSYSNGNNPMKNIPNYGQTEKAKLQSSHFHFMPNLDNEAIAQLLQLPKDSSAHIKITLKNLEDIIINSNQKDKDEVIGILGPVPNTPHNTDHIPAWEHGSHQHNMNNENIIKEFQEEKDLLEQFVSSYEVRIIFKF